MIKSNLPSSYPTLLASLKQRIAAERVRVVLSANSAMVMLYWEIGQAILERQLAEGWGAKVIDRLSRDLRGAFPDMRGLSPRNLKYMRAFALAWPDREIVQQAAAQIPWGHNLMLLDKLDSPDQRLWYTRKALEQGWSRAILDLQIERQLYLREGKAASNFPATLPPAECDMAAQAFKDPYLFDFLGTADPRAEREVEQALVDHIQRFLLELGSGFAFVGRQVRIEVGDGEYVIDLLFYHLRLRCYVVIELKARRFEPGFTGQLNFYLSAVDDLMRHPTDNPTIGLLLVRDPEKDGVVVEYALRGLNRPIGVASWETELVRRLPADFEGSLPSVEQLEQELAGEE
jgi:predicted nuclease of restriction endonuclease-like (RecB) superfamily